MSIRRCLGRFALAVAAVVLGLLCPRLVHAQLAPTGAHYGAKASDTGHDLVGPNNNGDFVASLPLDLPPARGGLPIPLQISSGKRGFGAAGIGWDIALSYVLVDHSFAHRRPAYQPAGPIASRDHIIVALPGRQADMAPVDATHWIARNAPDLSMSLESGNYKVFDGSGLTYTFVMKPEVATAGVGLWLLDSITGPGNASVKLNYGLELGSVSTTQGQTLAIDLSEVDYNPHPTGSCFKTRILLGYEVVASDAPALSLSVLGPAALVRKHKLDSVDVISVATCGASAERLSHYSLQYQPDPDTGLQRLAGVKVSGRDGTAEANTTIALAAYGYGTATSVDSTGARTLQYHGDQAISFPAAATAANHDYFADTVQVGGALFQSPVGGVAYASTQAFMDFTGDGRPDLVFMDSSGHLQIARNQPSPGSAAAFTAIAPFTDSTFTKQILDARTSSVARFTKTPIDKATEEYVWREAIDVNGDGRVDFIDASETPNTWIVYLNKPDPGPSGIKWVRRAYDVTRLRKELQSDGLSVPGSYLPLSRRISARPRQAYQCFRWDETTNQYVEDPGSVDVQPACKSGGWPPLPPAGLERTFVDWEITDVNGDGYVDVVFNGSSTVLKGNKPDKPLFGAPPAYKYFPQTFDLQRAGNADVFAAFNVAGIALHFDSDPQDPFSQSTILIRNNWCGVELWSGDKPYGQELQELTCAFADVNGDGIVDRVENKTATLGTGTGFATVQIALPSYLDVHLSGYSDQCMPGTTFQTSQWGGLRDLTGDGIPDLLYRDLTVPNPPLRLAIGTGAGFTTVPLANWQLSREDEFCDGTASNTVEGLYDITGDGKPDFITLTSVTASNWVFNVSELVSAGTAGAPEAGRIVSVDNGAGAVTTISYRSAKDDNTTLHQVPFPEIVVDHTDTDGAYHLGGSLTRTSFAYGNTSQFYDSTLDGFRSTGYLRRVRLTTTATSGGSSKSPGSAEIVDRYPLDDFNYTLSDDGRFLRYQKAGQPSDSAMLAVAAGTDPWSLLTVNIFSDVRRMRGSHAVVAAHVFPGSSSQPFADCTDVTDPFDYENSLALAAGSQYRPCIAHGYAYVSDSTAWRGSSGPPMSEHVETHTSVLQVDSSGRPLSVFQDGDAQRTDDDLCVDVTYAAPAVSGLHVPSLPATRKVWGCSKNPVTYAEDSFEYDGLPSLLVSQGLVTSHTVHRHATDTGTDYGAIREYDISYDALANPSSAVTTREDGATRTVTTTYDEFGLFPLHTTVQGSGLPALTVDNTFDPVSGELLTSTDATGTSRGSTFDGFGRPLYQIIQTPGSSAGVQSAWTYQNFENPSLGRQVQEKTFVDPVPAGSVSSSEGRVATTFLDELARPRFTWVELGDDYGKQILVVGSRSYDGLGRVTFEADPFPTSQAASTAYGTTQFFNQDGTLDVSIRGRGPQSYSTVPDSSVERYPTIFKHTFANYQETTVTQTSDALIATSPQYGVVQQAVSTATGRVLSRSTYQSATRLEYEELSYDHLNQLTTLTRYQDAATPANPVAWAWYLDSLGHVTKLTEPSSAPQTRSYSYWGELLNIEWATTSPEPVHDIYYTYDALGRITHSEERNGTVKDPDTLYDYGYDTARSSPIADNLYTLGRLSYALGPSSETRFGYDAYGNVAAQTFIDNKDASTYVEEDGYHADGSKKFIELALPDASYVPERMDYEYDTAGRLRWMWFNDGSNTQELLSITDLDVWGRMRAATFGPNTFTGNYNDTGRRLPKSVTVQAGTKTRSFSFDSFDAVGRELARTQNTLLFAGTETRTYDALGRLSTTNRKQNSTTVGKWQFSYDPLGNVGNLNDQIGTADATLSYLTTDRDRICRIGYGNNGLGGTACNVTYDSFGNVVVEPTRTGSNRLAYLNSGLVRRVANASGYDSTFHYDPFGQLETLDITSTAQSRSDHHYGALMLKRSQASTSGSVSYVSREFPGAGFVVSRRGPKGPWVYEYSDSNGTRFTTDDSGTFAQDLDYAPFGEATSKGAQPGTTEYSSSQWNEGDALDGFGLVQLGARVYDPVIGRFLSRDPLVMPRTASSTNPYAFALNDPINLSDPTGMDPNPDPCAGKPLCLWTNDTDSSSALGSATALGLFAADALFTWNSEPPTDLSNKAQLAAYFGAFDAELGRRQQRYDLNIQIGQVQNFFGGPSLEDTVDWAGDVADGFAGGMYDMGAGMLHMATHPYQTVRGFGYMLAHPVQTGKAIVGGAVATGSAILHGDGHALGHAIATAYGPGIAAKAVSAVAGVTGLSRLVRASKLPALEISASKYPEMADNISNALKAGHPDILTHGGDVIANRAAALDGVPRIPGFSRDEFPFASSMEGGAGSWVGHVPVVQQSAQGGLLSQFIRANGITAGMQYQVVIVP